MTDKSTDKKISMRAVEIVNANIWADVTEFITALLVYRREEDDLTALTAPRINYKEQAEAYFWKEVENYQGEGPRAYPGRKGNRAEGAR